MRFVECFPHTFLLLRQLIVAVTNGIQNVHVYRKKVATKLHSAVEYLPESGSKYLTFRKFWYWECAFVGLLHIGNRRYKEYPAKFHNDFNFKLANTSEREIVGYVFDIKGMLSQKDRYLMRHLCRAKIDNGD